MGRGHVPRDLPAARLGVRPRDRHPAVACRRTSRSRPTRSRSRTASCRSRSTRADSPLLGDDRPALQRLPRRGVGPPGARRAGRLRAALPRGLPVGPLVADDPAQARGLPRGVRGLRSRTASPAFGERDVERLLGDASIVRHRGKIEATIANARATVALREADAAARALLVAPAGAHAPSPSTQADWQRVDARVGRALEERSGRPASASSARRPSTRPCRPAASSTTTSPTAGCGKPSRQPNAWHPS